MMMLVMMLKEILIVLIVLLVLLPLSLTLRSFRSWSHRAACANSQDPSYPFAYNKYLGQLYENKGRTNSNRQDFRHTCQVYGGTSKCSVCQDVRCDSNRGPWKGRNPSLPQYNCSLQFQGVAGDPAIVMSTNVPTVSDVAWAVNGKHRFDYGGSTTTHYCVFLSGGKCIKPSNKDFNNCKVRCFGYGNHTQAARTYAAANVTLIDTYPGMGRWKDDGMVDIWAYPKNCDELYKYDKRNCTYSQNGRTPTNFNPQGFTFTVAGTPMMQGFTDGKNAKFNFPSDLAIDKYGYTYVADTGNNAIRMIYPNGTVTTIAGQGPGVAGSVDGTCKTASFNGPKGLDARVFIINGVETVVILVADTNNHRIRRIDYIRSGSNKKCNVICLSGLCGNNTLSATLMKTRATPLSGYADGYGNISRFSVPESIAFMDNGYAAVADTGNFLIRWLQWNNGTTYTLAGSVVPSETDFAGNPLPGCPPPCLRGDPGLRDGSLNISQFYNPIDVTQGPNNTLFVVDENRVRMIELYGVITTWQGIQSTGRVSTIAGTAQPEKRTFNYTISQGHEDGYNTNASFFNPSGIFVTNDNIAYVVDAASCRVRRISPMINVAKVVECGTTASQLIRPSGCTSFDQPLDNIGRKVTRVEADTQYSYGYPYEDNIDKGKYIKNCVGSPPSDTFDKKFLVDGGLNLVIDDLRVKVNEDSEQGLSMMLQCSGKCFDTNGKWKDSAGKIYGHKWYAETSNPCHAAAHAGLWLPKTGTTSYDDAFVQIIFERLDYASKTNAIGVSKAYNNGPMYDSQNYSLSNPLPSRVFQLSPLHIYQSVVHTVAGAPVAPLDFGCGYQDNQPATLASFNKPRGIAGKFVNFSTDNSASDTTFLYIADTNNHVIRGLSAVCTQICENGGRCVGPDKCKCPAGWKGIDCTIPICTSPICSANQICTSPNTCTCPPGWINPPGLSDCSQALCLQTCYNGASCTAPDTCTCSPGWFDSNCTTPICSRTCANGGSCVAPGTCQCPSQWTGVDCRIPVCNPAFADCKNGGFCVAPDTCICPPLWTGLDCSKPVCYQGYFESDGYQAPQYKQCNIERWCSITNEFECDQTAIEYGIIEVPSGPAYKLITGRDTRPTSCMQIELPYWYKIPFALRLADNTTTDLQRFSPIIPYDTNPLNPWAALLTPTSGHTGPWTYRVDRQVANVNWLNITQGRYVCANGGQCVAPGQCACAPGWIGFDCRTPVCTQGYYSPKQADYVSGQHTPTEVADFSRFMNTTPANRFSWNYSNPTYTMIWESYNYSDPFTLTNVSNIAPNWKGFSMSYETNTHGGLPYLSTVANAKQGGYRCSIRSVTQYENSSYIWSHPNYYSRYQTRTVQKDGNIYTFWDAKMGWYPTTQKSRIIDQYLLGYRYAYTSEGYRRLGIWNTTGSPWVYGICIMEFKRNCSDPSKEYDIYFNEAHGIVQDTDRAYRPNITMDEIKIYSKGRWKTNGGECIDEVLRGCYNNGTCIAPNTCLCPKGWIGTDCSIPDPKSCDCKHNGVCTLPGTCTCEKGWTGNDCSRPLCSQECQNGGTCVAPDVCQCYQWPNSFVDGRVGGGQPLFAYKDASGNAYPLNTGWTGFDCSTPICVQGDSFNLNIPLQVKIALGGRGGDDKLTCLDSTGKVQPRCPQFNNYVTGNDGNSFQTGCGYDPYDTGCCIDSLDDPILSKRSIQCYKCADSDKVLKDNTFYCKSNNTLVGEVQYKIGSYTEKPKIQQPGFLDASFNVKLCGAYTSPRVVTVRDGKDYGYPLYYKNRIPLYSSYNDRANWTSNRYLCGISQWIQGDYIDDAGMGSILGAGSLYGLENGRHVRINAPFKVRGEGIYSCANSGSCLGPDICTCQDGYEGYDCRTPLCRHLQPTGKVTSCLNGGICTSRDFCTCIQIDSVLWRVHPEGERGLTGWTGTDCSMPICVQGYFDPFCTDLDEAPGGQGCYRCANGGNCTAPDVCKCAPGWTGYDCKTPVCEVVADPLTRFQLGTFYEDKVIAFESDPCGATEIHAGVRGWKGTKYARGNCTSPNLCTCLCKIPYLVKTCHKTGFNCDGPWQDPLSYIRNVMTVRGSWYSFGSTDCAFGYEGNVDLLDRFVTCHQTIYYPSNSERISLELIAGILVAGSIFGVAYYFIYQRMKTAAILAKIERRRSKRSSEESLLQSQFR